MLTLQIGSWVKLLLEERDIHEVLKQLIAEENKAKDVKGKDSHYTMFKQEEKGARANSSIRGKVPFSTMKQIECYKCHIYRKARFRDA